MKLEKRHLDLLRHFSQPTPTQFAPSPGCHELRDASYLTIERAAPYGFKITTTDAGRKALGATFPAGGTPKRHNDSPPDAA